MIKYVNGKKVEYEETLPEEPIKPMEENIPALEERIQALEKELAELKEALK